MVNLELSLEDISFIISCLEYRQTIERLICENAVDVGDLSVILNTQKNIGTVISLNNRLYSCLNDNVRK